MPPALCQQEILVLPGRLVWAPEAATCSQEVGTCVKALDLCEHGRPTPSPLAVLSAKTSCGKSIGSVDLDNLLHFCRGLESILGSNKKVVLTTPLGDRPYRLNALVMLGAYLILQCNWSVEHLENIFGADAKSKITCSWPQVAMPEAVRVLAIADCFHGIALAAKRRWIKAAFMEDNMKLQAEVTRFCIRPSVFDATWIIPGLMLMAADPTSKVYDPNRATCSPTFPSSGCAIIEKSLSQLTEPYMSATTTSTTVYTESPDDSVPFQAADAPQDYVSFMRERGVGLVVRIDNGDKEGMLCKNYADDTFRPYGIEQASIGVEDAGGAPPKPKEVAQLIQACEGRAAIHDSCRAVLFHTNGGFGQSVTLAVCLAIYRHDVQGRDMLCWMQMCHQGAIITRKQQQFLKSLKGRRDLMRYARMPFEGDLQERASCTGCSLQ